MRAVLLLLAVSLGAQTLSERGVTLARQQVDEFRQEPRVAVIVAVDQYQEESGFRKLEYATKDASALAAALQAADFSYNVRTLLNERALRTVIRTAIRNAAQVAGSKGTLLFFSAGHGGQDGKQYLAAYEAGADNLSELGLPISEVRDLMNQSNAARKILIVDACRNDPTAKASRSASDDTLQRFGRLEESEGLRILNATAPNQVSYEDPKFGHGVFAHFLLEGLGGKATDPYGMITFRSLSDYVSREVRNYSYPIGRLQIPYEAGSGFGDFLVGGKLGPPQIVKPAPLPAGPGPTDPAREAWERAKSSTNKAGALQAIVREFPNSDYARLARVDLAGMGAAPGEALFNEALKLFDQGEIPLAGAVFDSVLPSPAPGNLAAAGYRALGRANGKRHVLRVGPFELRGLERFHIGDGVRQPLPQFAKGLFGIGRGRHLASGQPRAALGSKVAGDLDLLRQRQHVRIEPRVEQHLGLDFLRLAMRLGLGQQAGKAAEDLQEGGNGRVVKGHLMALCCSEIAKRSRNGAAGG